MNGNSPPAFPRPASDAHAHGMHEPQSGMTLRDYFAAKAMRGLLGELDLVVSTPAKICELAYVLADAMLNARGQ